MKKHLTLHLLFFTSLFQVNLLAVEEKNIDMIFDKIIFQNDKLLGKEIFLSLPFGTLKAKNAEIMGNPKEDKEILLKDDIEFLFTDKSKINSDSAIIKGKKKVVEFNKIKKQILFQKKFIKNKIAYPISILSNKIIAKKNNINSVDLNFLEEITVRITPSCTLNANKAVYKEEEIVFTPKKECFCEIRYKDKLQIKSPYIRLNLKTMQLSIINPKGSLYDGYNFSCTKIYLNDMQTIFFEGNVEIAKKNTLLKSRKAKIELDDNKLDKIYLYEENKILLGQTYFFTKDVLYFDIKKNNILNISNVNTQGFYMQKDNFKIFGKNAYVKLDCINNSFTINHALFEKDIYFVSESHKNFFTYGLAEKITYYPNKNLFYLESSKKEKVLLTRSDNSLSLAADKIEIFHKKNSKEDIIKGIGKVRFSLNEKENEKIKEIILKYKL